MINKHQKTSLIYFLSNSFFLASGYSLIFKTSGKDSWAAMLLGILWGSLFIFFINHIKNKKNKYAYIKIPFFIFILFINIIVVRIFASSFFLTNTPGYIITIPFLFLAYLASTKGLKTISKISEILFPVSIIFLLLNMLAVTKDGTIDSFLPIMTTSSKNIFLSSLYFALFTACPNILLKESVKKENISIKSYLFSCAFTLFIGLIIIYTLGPKLITIFRFPEYMVLKQLQLFNFLEKIENLIGLIWFFDLFISISLCFYNINENIKVSNRITIVTLVTITILGEFVASNYIWAMFIYKNLPWLLLGFTLLYLTSFIANKKTTSKLVVKS